MGNLAILGNGISRRSLVEEINTLDEVWVCNKAFYEISNFPNIKRVYSVHTDVLLSFLEDIQVLEGRVTLHGPTESSHIIPFKEPRGWSSGNQAILDALIEGYEKIYLFGFDFGGRDFYQSHILEGSNFKKQYAMIMEDARFNASQKLVLRYPEVYEQFTEKKNEKEDIGRLTIDLGDSSNLSKEELEEIVLDMEYYGGVLHGKGISLQYESPMGFLIRRILRMPMTSERDDTWAFYFEEDIKCKYRNSFSCEEMEFSNFLKNKKVVFVGPSPNMKGLNLGEYIDSFDIVIRTNNMINTLINDKDIMMDYGKRTDILYTNVTYEKDSFHEWRVDDWKEYGLKYIVRKFKNKDEKSFPIPWRFLPRKNIGRGNFSLGVHLIYDLLSFPIKSLNIYGIDGYINMPEVISESSDEYVNGYLPSYHVEYRKNNIGKKSSNHDKYLDSAKILEMAESDSRVILDERVRNSLEEVINGRK